VLVKSKSIKEGADRVFVLILDQGEEAFKAIGDFAISNGSMAPPLRPSAPSRKPGSAGLILPQKKYKPIGVKEQCEVLSLMGDIAKGDDGKASLHLHAVLGLQDGSVRGGHFLSGSVQPTLEVTITETAAHLRRKQRADLGIALISI
jgi:predicted DNA-binding protein with PD1-like motif